MTKVIFTKPFNYRPSANWRVTLTYRASEDPQEVNLECADEAVAKGYAKYVDEDKRDKRAKYCRLQLAHTH